MTWDRNAKAPAPVLIFFQLDWIDLLTRFLGLRRLRLVTVLVFARLVLRLANEYYGPDLNLCVQKKNNGLFFSCTACTRSDFQDSHSH